MLHAQGATHLKATTLFQVAVCQDYVGVFSRTSFGNKATRRSDVIEHSASTVVEASLSKKGE